MSPSTMIVKKHNWQQMVRAISARWGGVSKGVGIDVGSHMVKTVALQADGNRLSLRDFWTQHVSGKSFESDEASIGLLKALQQKISVPLHAVGISLSGPSVFVKSLNLPVMTEADLQEHLSLELDRYIALEVQDVFWDVYHRKSNHGCQEGQQEHFLVVAKKEYVKRQVDRFHQCGMTVSFVDVDIFALVNMVTHNYGNDGSWLLVHLGPSGILMVGLLEGEPVYIRKGSYMAEWYGDLLDQVLLYQTGMDSGKELGASELLLLEQFYQEICDRIRETLESLSDVSTAAVDGGILLSGGYASVPEMAMKLSSALGMSVNIVNPFQEISVPQAIQEDSAFQRIAPLMGVAVGVALRGAVPHD